MQKLWGQVCTVRPCDRPSLWIYECLAEERHIAQRLKYIASKFAAEIDISFRTIRERDRQTMTAEVPDGRDVEKRGWHGSQS